MQGTYYALPHGPLRHQVPHSYVSMTGSPSGPCVALSVPAGTVTIQTTNVGTITVDTKATNVGTRATTSRKGRPGG